MRGLIEIFPDQIILVAGQFSDWLGMSVPGVAPAANNYTNMVISNLHHQLSLFADLDTHQPASLAQLSVKNIHIYTTLQPHTFKSQTRSLSM